MRWLTELLGPDRNGGVVHRHMRRYASTGLGIAFALLLSALVPSVASATTRAAHRTQPRVALTPVTFAIAESASVAPFYLGLLKGIYRQYGLNVTFPSLLQTTANAAVIAGNVDFAFISAGLFEAEANNPVDKIVLSNGTVAVDLETDSNITSWADLKGKTVGVTSPGSTTEAAFLAAAKANGLEPGTYNLAFLQNATGEIAGMESGKVQAVVQGPPTNVILSSMGYPTLANISKYSIDGELAVNGAWAKHHVKVVRRFIEASCAATKLAKANRLYAEAAMTDYVGLTTKAQLDSTWNGYRKIWACEPYPVSDMRTILTQQAVPPITVNPKSFIDDSYFNGIPKSDWIVVP